MIQLLNVAAWPAAGTIPSRLPPLRFIVCHAVSLLARLKRSIRDDVAALGEVLGPIRPLSNVFEFLVSSESKVHSNNVKSKKYGNDCDHKVRRPLDEASSAMRIDRLTLMLVDLLLAEIVRLSLHFCHLFAILVSQGFLLLSLFSLLLLELLCIFLIRPSELRLFGFGILKSAVSLLKRKILSLLRLKIEAKHNQELKDVKKN